MWLGELSERSGVPLSSIKFYLRSGLLPMGRREPGRRAEYGEDHLERLRTIRSLVEDAGLGLERVREVLDETTDDEAFGRTAALLGRRWMLDLVRILARGPHRFTDVRAALPAVSATVLTQRLRELEDVGLVHRERLPPPAASATYGLSAAGAGLVPAVAVLESWSRRAGRVEPDQILSTVRRSS